MKNYTEKTRKDTTIALFGNLGVFSTQMKGGNKKDGI